MAVAGSAVADGRAARLRMQMVRSVCEAVGPSQANRMGRNAQSFPFGPEASPHAAASMCTGSERIACERMLARVHEPSSLLRIVRLVTTTRRTALLYALAVATVLVPIVVPFGDEVTTVRTELREAGYVVESVEAVDTGWVTGNDGRAVALREGERAYRVIYRGAGGSRNEGYRLMGAGLGKAWMFSPSVAAH